MANIDIKLKSYDELVFEIITLNTNKYLLEQKLNKYKEVLDKIKELSNRVKEEAKEVENEWTYQVMKELDFLLEVNNESN